MKSRCWEFVPAKNRPIVFLFHFQGWNCLSLGIHFDFKMLNLELHLPFCFIRIGKDSVFDTCVCKEAPEELEEAQKQQPTNKGFN